MTIYSYTYKIKCWLTYPNIAHPESRQIPKPFEPLLDAGLGTDVGYKVTP